MNFGECDIDSLHKKLSGKFHFGFYQSSVTKYMKLKSNFINLLKNNSLYNVKYKYSSQKLFQYCD